MRKFTDRFHTPNWFYTRQPGQTGRTSSYDKALNIENFLTKKTQEETFPLNVSHYFFQLNTLILH